MVGVGDRGRPPEFAGAACGRLAADDAPPGSPARAARPRLDHSSDPADHYIRCAEFFLDIHETFVNHDQRAAVLWNAVECYEAAGASNEAADLMKLLIERYPDSDHARAAKARAASE